MKGTLAECCPDLVSSHQLHLAHTLADALRDELGLDEALAPFRPQEYRAEAPGGGAVLHLEDVSGIPFVRDVAGVAEYQHRARVRAESGDFFAASSAPVAGYEAYCQGHLGLGEPAFLSARARSLVPGGDPSDGGAMAVAAELAKPQPFEALARHMRARDGLIIHPYMAIESVWALAKKLNQRVPGARARVLGPPPPVLWLANDKARLTEMVARVGDGAWHVETRVEHTPEAMSEALDALAARHKRVGLKRTRCASAMGNRVFDSSALRQLRPDERRERVAQFLSDTEWRAGEPVLVLQWADACDSPSTQMWIGPADGAPAQSIRLDGIFQQILDGERGVFVGSRPSTLARPVERRLAEMSFVMAAIFQQLGYVGRCSFDFILTGDPMSEDPEGWDARIIECNGRWGGTSTPMHLVDRLVRGPRPAYIAQDFVHPGLVGAQFGEVLAACRDELFDPRTGQGRFIFYNCGPLAECGKFDVISVASTPQQALDGVHRVLPRCLALN